MNKKAISLLISWVLMIGFVVGLAIFVTTWSRQQAEESIGGVTEMIESDVRCNDVSLNIVEKDCEKGKAKLVNRGYFTIYRLVIREYKEDAINTNEINLEIKPGDDKGYDVSFGKNKIEVIPIIKIDEKFVGCSEKKVLIEC